MSWGHAEGAAELSITLAQYRDTFLSVQALVLFLSAVSILELRVYQLSDCYSLSKLLSRFQIPLQLSI